METSEKLFLSETLQYVLTGAQLNQLLTLVMAFSLDTSHDPEFLLLAKMNDCLHATGLLESLMEENATAKKFLKAIQTFFSAMVGKRKS